MWTLYGPLKILLSLNADLAAVVGTLYFPKGNK
jgi:hypothetical protein